MRRPGPALGIIPIRNERIVAVVPVKSLDVAKSRLSDRLSPDDRARLVFRLLDAVLTAVRQSSAVGRCLVVSRDRRIREHALAWDVEAMDEGNMNEPPFDPLVNGASGGGLRPDASYNRALEAARLVAIERWNPAALLVLAADLPRLTADDVAAMIALGATDRTVVVAPDRWEIGTNGLLLRPPAAIPFRFGARSFEQHRGETAARGLRLRLYRASGTAIDVDEPDDLEASIR